jgi:hypothetical protein
MSRFTRGFTVWGRTSDLRLPPGQYDTGRSWPVLTAEVTPELETASWTFAIEGLVEHPTMWSWDEIHALPQDSYDGAIPASPLGRSSTCTGKASRSTRCSPPRLRSRQRHTSSPSHTPATPRTCPSMTSPPARRRSPFRSTAPPWGATTAARRGCWCRTCTSGKAPNGSPAFACSIMTNRGSGKCAATTTAATRGSNSAIKATDQRCRATSTYRRSDRGSSPRSQTGKGFDG